MSNTKIKAGQFSGIVGNGTDGYFLMTNGDGTMAWQPAGAPSPTVTSVTYPGDDTAADPAGGQSVTLTGTNFATGATVTIGGTTAPTVSFVSATELTITTPAKAAGDYDIVVTNTDGGTATFVDGISYNGIPSWTTASGSLGTFASDTTISTITLQASEPDAGTITFNITSGALPTGLSLTGADIDGTTSKETADTLYNFTVTAIDDENQSTPRAFSITVEKYIVPAPENFEIVTYTGNGGTQAITSKIGKAASFNGSSSYIDVSSLTYLFDSRATAAVSFWFNTSTTATTSVLFSDYASSSARNFLVYTNSTGNIVWNTRYGSVAGRDSNITTTSSYNDGNWHHIVLSIDQAADTKSMYVDGSQIGSSIALPTTTGEIFDSAQRVTIGSSYNTGAAAYQDYLNGKIDQVRIFNKALSSSEVTTLYNETYASSTKSTTDIFGDGSGVALYELDEDANDTGTTGTAIDAGQSAVFNGGNNYINVNSKTFTNNKVWSISAFVKWNQNPSGNQYITYLGNYNLRLEGKAGENRIVFWDGSAERIATSPISVDIWQHIVGTYDGNNLRLYVNGVNVDTLSVTTSPLSISLQERIGAASDGSGDFNGSLDELRIYNSTLSSTDVGYIYNNTIASIPTSNLLAHYKFDGNANDETGNYNGSATSGITYANDPAYIGQSGYNGTPTNVNFLGMAFQPDLVWIKRRDGANNNSLYDTVRGAQQELISNLTSAEILDTDALTSFDSNGFSLGADGNNNLNTGNYVAWCFKAGGSAVSNTDGDLITQVSANTEAGFSIATYTGSYTGDTTKSIGHGLNTKPDIFIVKNRTQAKDWYVYTDIIDGSMDFLYLNSTDAKGDSSRPLSTNTVNYIGGASTNNVIGDEYVVYSFHSVDGYQKVGSYTGNNPTASTIRDINVGFTPRFVLLKNTTTSGPGWNMYDSTRPSGQNIFANSSNAEADYSALFEIITDGFRLKSVNTNTNYQTNNFIYLAIA